MSVTWHPGVEVDMLRQRARLLDRVRDFFRQRAVLEITTPTLGATGVSDVHIRNVSLTDAGRTYYLQTSPEYAMKRLLAAGSGPIFQICPAYRGGETGPRHNVEFTLVEWYRPQFRLTDLIEEIGQMIQELTAEFQGARVVVAQPSYKSLFLQRFGVNPHSVETSVLAKIARDEFGDSTAHIDPVGDEATRNDYLDLLFSLGIERHIEHPTIVSGYPSSQAALAETGPDADGDWVAHRFELLWQGFEIGNGYQELQDAAQLRDRMNKNNALRSARGLPVIPLDEKLLAALPSMPSCSGVALGVDRLMMCLTGKKTLGEVTAFAGERL